MNKSIVNPVITIITIALVGLIIIQGYWIYNAYSLKEQQFDHLVDGALGRIINEIQEYEIYHIAVEEMRTDHSVSDTLKVASLAERIKQTEQGMLRNQRTFSFWNSLQFRFINPWVSIMEMGMKQNQETDPRFMPPSPLIVRHNYPSFNMDNYGPNRIPTRRRDMLIYRISEKLEQRIYESISIEERISQTGLNAIIYREFESSNIPTSYQYCVLSNNGQLAYTSSGFNFSTRQKRFTRQLFPYDLTEHTPYYLSIYFPDEIKFLWRNIGFMSILSILLTLVITFSFSYTLVVILKQKKINELRNNFMNNMTHELKTPISTISLASQMLNDKSIPIQSKNVEHLASVIADESQRLKYQVEKVLKMAVFDKGEIRLKKKQLDVHEVIAKVVKSTIIQITNRNGTLTTDFMADCSMVNADEVHFTNIIFNLLDNAIKYSKGSPIISIKTRNENNNIVISVEDHGIGISKEYQKKIFEKFFRVPTGNLHNVKGFGLGLSYVKNIVDSHDGTIVVDSKINVGTRFDISIPILPM